MKIWTYNFWTHEERTKFRTHERMDMEVFFAWDGLDMNMFRLWRSGHAYFWSRLRLGTPTSENQPTRPVKPTSENIALMVQQI